MYVTAEVRDISTPSLTQSVETQRISYEITSAWLNLEEVTFQEQDILSKSDLGQQHAHDSEGNTNIKKKQIVLTSELDVYNFM